MAGRLAQREKTVVSTASRVGLAVCDVYVGSYPFLLSCVLRLPTLVSVHPALPEPLTGEITLYPTPGRPLSALSLGDLPPAARVREELAASLRADDARLAAEAVHRQGARTAAILAIRSVARSSCRASAVHVRTIPSLVQSARPARAPDRPRHSASAEGSLDRVRIPRTHGPPRRREVVTGVGVPEAARVGSTVLAFAILLASAAAATDLSTIRAFSVADGARALRTLHDAGLAPAELRSLLGTLLGVDRDRQYLLLFQNHRELRPTGGFLGSFALVDVSRGKVRKVLVDTIYDPDGQLRDRLRPPSPVSLVADRWYIRDANWFADFRESARKVASLFERSGGPTVDGVFAVTPVLLEDLLRLTGPIPMPSYGVTVSADTVTDLTQYLVTYAYDRERNEPKKFIADLLPEVLDRVVRLPPDKTDRLTEVLLTALTRKHLLLWFRDPRVEEPVVRLGFGGALPVLPRGEGVLADHLGRVEANLGGHKTDVLIEQSVEYAVTVDSNGDASATLIVTRTHRGPKTGTPGLPPDEDPAKKTNVVYERTLVPAGSVLLSARGFTTETAVPRTHVTTLDPTTLTKDPDLQALEEASSIHPSGVVVGTESGFTTIGGWVVTAPEETTVTVLQYRLPFRFPKDGPPAARYVLALTHQPGHLPVLTKVQLRVGSGASVAWSGPSRGVAGSGRETTTFSAVLERDQVIGAVLTRP